MATYHICPISFRNSLNVKLIRTNVGVVHCPWDGAGAHGKVFTVPSLIRAMVGQQAVCLGAWLQLNLPDRNLNSGVALWFASIFHGVGILESIHHVEIVSDWHFTVKIKP